MATDSGISRDEWLKALTDIGISHEDDQSAVTIAEFARLCGLSRSAAGRRMQHLLDAGKAVRTMKWALATDGRRQHNVAYKLSDGTRKSRK